MRRTNSDGSRFDAFTKQASVHTFVSHLLIGHDAHSGAY